MSFPECGDNKLRKSVDQGKLDNIRKNQVKQAENYGICTNVVISDRFVLTAAHCLEKYVNLKIYYEFIIMVPMEIIHIVFGIYDAEIVA